MSHEEFSDASAGKTFAETLGGGKDEQMKLKLCQRRRANPFGLLSFQLASSTMKCAQLSPFRH